MADNIKGISSIGTKLYYKSGAEYVEIDGLQEIPDLGGETESIEVTTLSDVAHIYIDGLKNYGDSLAFKFVYLTDVFNTVSALSGSQDWKVSLPDGAACTFSGTCSTKLDGIGLSNALTYTLSIKPNSEMTWA
jgi:hypothetical protein